jgi:hypothetical protein
MAESNYSAVARQLYSPLTGFDRTLYLGVYMQVPKLSVWRLQKKDCVSLVAQAMTTRRHLRP